MAKKKNTEKRSRALEFQVTEAYKKARTNLVYSIIKKGCKKVIVTSPYKSEGKTTTAVNVAIALAQQVDTKVLIIDCDLRRPTIHTFFDIKNDRGLANYLTEECTLEEAVSHTDNENLDLISFGAIPPNPSELLSSESMKQMVKELEGKYDYILFDTPPVNMVIDVIPIISLSDGVVLVTKHKDTTYPELNKAIDTLKRNNAKILGIIVNQIPTLETSKGGYYLYRARRSTYYRSQIY